MTWIESGWSVSPAYAYASAAGGQRYQFSGPPRSGVRGVRVTGATGPNAWSAIVNEVQVIGQTASTSLTP